MDALNLADAMELFKLPRTLGVTADGETVITNVGRFGPYVKYGSKYVSLKEDDPYDVSLERALEVIRLKQEADANRTITDFGVDGIQVLNGRYGPYVTDGKKNAKIPKDRDPKTLTLEECRVLIEQAPARGAGRFGRGKRGAAGKNAGGSKTAAAGGKAAGGNGKATANGTGADAIGAPAGDKASKAKRPRPSTPASAGAKSAATAGSRPATARSKSTASAGSGPATAGAESPASAGAKSPAAKASATATKPAAAKKSAAAASAAGKAAAATAPAKPTPKPPTSRPRGEK
jgi:DNA topoisomerase-1